MRHRNYQGVRQVTNEEFARAQGLTPAELQKTQVLNLKEVEEAVRFEKLTSKKPAIFIAVIGILCIACGTTFQVLQTMNANKKPVAEKRLIPEEKIEKVVEKTSLQCNKIDTKTTDGTEKSYTIDYSFEDNKLVSATKIFHVTTKEEKDVDAIKEYYKKIFQKYINQSVGYDIQMLTLESGIEILVQINYNEIDLTKLNPQQQEHYSTKVNYTKNTTIEMVKADMKAQSMTCSE